jgi:hypothetical protein
MPPAFPDARLLRAGISAARVAQLQALYNAMGTWEQGRFRALVASRPDEVLRRTYDPAGAAPAAGATTAEVVADPALLTAVQTAILAAHDTDAERESFVPARLSDTALRAALGSGRKTWVDLRDFPGYDGTGAADQTGVLQAAVNQAQAADGASIFIPNGRHKFTGTVVMQGATSPDGWSGKGGIYLVGESMEGAILQQTVAAPLLQWGTTTSKVAMGLATLTLAGPGKTVPGSVGLDSRTTGGSYTLDTIHVRDFEIGIREHDNTLVDARSVNVRNCGKGWALGYFSDAHTFLGCRADGCDIGYHVGYFDPTQGEAAQTESHGLTWLGGMSNLCGVGIYIEGSATEAITVIGTYFEQYSDVAVRIGHADGTSSVSAGIDIKGYFNGDRKAAPVGKVAHAIEINNAKTVRLGRGGYRSHTVASVNVKNTGAKVTIDPGNFSRASGESDVKLPDGTLINVGKERPLTVGQVSARAVNRAAALPTASADWAGAELDVAGVLYRCGADGAGGYAWYAQPTAKALSSTPSAAAVAGSLRQRVVTGQSRYYTAIGGTVGTGQVGAATAAAIPIFLDTDVTITELAAEVTTAGAAGSLLRLGLYSDNAGVPGTLLVDAGTVDATTTGVKTLTVSQAVSAGVVWAVACSQGSPATEPTLRTINGPIVGVPAISAGSTSQSTFKTTGLATGGLPGTWSLAGGIGGVAPRVQVKVG